MIQLALKSCFNKKLAEDKNKSISYNNILPFFIDNNNFLFQKFFSWFSKNIRKKYIYYISI